MKLNTLIARGRTAEIFAWQEGWILKLFYNGVNLEDIEYEAYLGRAVHATGLAVPAVGEIVHVNERMGLLYERVDGIEMVDLLAKKPWRVFHYARRLADLQSEMHKRSMGEEFPSQRVRIKRKINQAGALSSHLKFKVNQMLESLPEGDRLCHGDFHPGNVLITSQAEVIIDWMDATRGNPLADVARTSVMILGAAGSTEISRHLVKMMARSFHTEYYRHYFRRNPGGEREYQSWLPVVAAARLSEEIPELENWLVSVVEGG